MTTDLSALKRRASVTHNKSLPEQARDAELLEVIAALERAVGLLERLWENGEVCMPNHDCVHEARLFLAAFPPPGGEGA